jgi:hypothetical protein
MGYLPTMRRSWRVLACGAVVAALLPGCSKHARVPAPAAIQGENAPALAVPLDVQEFQVVSAEGFRGVFVKLSRLPDAVAHRNEGGASIVLEISGPTGGESPEQAFPGGDNLVSSVRVSRTYGKLRVAIDLASDDAPSYTVHTMADWIMVRFAPERG